MDPSVSMHRRSLRRWFQYTISGGCAPPNSTLQSVNRRLIPPFFAVAPAEHPHFITKKGKNPVWQQRHKRKEPSLRTAPAFFN